MNYNDIIEKIMDITKICLALLVKFNPDPKFLSDVAAVEAVIIAIAIPFSFEIVSRISERYQSEVISNLFAQSWTVIWLPKLLVINIVLAVGIRFLVNSNPSSVIWKFSAWIVFMCFLFIGAILFSFVRRLRYYMIDTKFISEELFDEVEKFFK